jgi:uroporphyrinogen decarboxylase
MHFEPVDRPPLWLAEEVTEGAVRRWIRDGSFPIGMTVGDVFPMDGRELVTLDTGPLPASVSHTIEDGEQWRTTQDAFGFTVRTLKEQSVTPTIYYYLDSSAHDRASWERLSERYDPHDVRRLPRAWGPELWSYYNEGAAPVGMRIQWGPGRGTKNGYTLGLERFLVMLADDPGLVKEIFDFWAGFVIAAARPWFEHVHFDFVYLSEDGIAYKNSTLVSPRMYRTLWGPALRRVTDFLHGYGVEIIAHETSGNICPLIPTLLDLGINLYLPLEVAAGMDALALRRSFGRSIRLIGNIARQALMDGPEAVRREVEAKVPPLMARGGYIPAVDDMILPDISFESYQCYHDLVRNYRCA